MVNAVGRTFFSPSDGILKWCGLGPQFFGHTILWFYQFYLNIGKSDVSGNNYGHYMRLDSRHYYIQGGPPFRKKKGRAMAITPFLVGWKKTQWPIEKGPWPRELQSLTELRPRKHWQSLWRGWVELSQSLLVSDFCFLNYLLGSHNLWKWNMAFFCFFKGMYYWRAKYFFTSMIMGGRVKQSVACELRLVFPHGFFTLTGWLGISLWSDCSFLCSYGLDRLGPLVPSQRLTDRRGFSGRFGGPPGYAACGLAKWQFLPEGDPARPKSRALVGYLELVKLVS